MNYDALKENLIYTLKEGELKLGYTGNSVSLNYPPASLCRLLGEELDAEELRRALDSFVEFARAEFGEIAFSEYEGQSCLTIPAEGVQYVHEQIPASPFLTELVDAVRSHAVHDMEGVLSIFRRYSDAVVCEAVDGDGYDHIVYFADGKPDGFIYLFETDSGHVSYHRMTRADYEAELTTN